MEENTEEEQKAEEAKSEPPLHNIFLDLSLENDLKGSELEWFKSRIFLDNFPKKKKKEEKAQAGRNVTRGYSPRSGFTTKFGASCVGAFYKSSDLPEVPQFQTLT